MPQRKSTHVQRTCLYCGRDFLARSGDVVRGWGKYCSRTCCDAAKVQPLEERFWSKVKKSSDPNGCWLWTGAIVTGRGYGQFESPYAGASRYAHRVAWEITHGPIPNGLAVCHNCPGGDNPRCVRPDHMFLGTSRQNTHDARQKGMLPRGEQNGSAKLTEADVVEIRRRYAAGEMNQPQLARHYGVAKSQIWNVIARKTWRHI